MLKIRTGIIWRRKGRWINFLWCLESLQEEFLIDEVSEIP